MSLPDLEIKYPKGLLSIDLRGQILTAFLNAVNRANCTDRIKLISSVGMKARGISGEACTTFSLQDEEGQPSIQEKAEKLVTETVQKFGLTVQRQQDSFEFQIALRR